MIKIFLILSLFMSFSASAEEGVLNYVIITWEVWSNSKIPIKSSYQSPILKTADPFNKLQKESPNGLWAMSIMHDYLEKIYKKKGLELGKVTGKVFDNSKEAKAYYNDNQKKRKRVNIRIKTLEEEYKKWAVQMEELRKKNKVNN